MGVQRQLNLLGQQRLDVPHLRAIESAVAADFDLLAGSIMAGQQALVVRGFEIDMGVGPIGNPATNVQLLVAGSALLHPLATEAGTIFGVAADAAIETLAPTNTKIVGAFTANATNFIGIDLRREADETTSDIVVFIDASTKLETAKILPLARTLSYRIVISTTDFASTPTICPIAKVVTDSANNVVSVEDARQMYYRLGGGGTSPNTQASFTFLNRRDDSSTIADVLAPTPDLFSVGDKGLGSEKSWKDAVMTRIWEVGGGTNWFSPTSEREMKLGFTSSVLPSGRNFDWDSGSSTISWQGLLLTFANSAGWYNLIEDGSSVLADGECLYVDVVRSRNMDGSPGNEALVVGKNALTTLGSPIIPGSRNVLAWRIGADVFFKDYPFDAQRTFGLPPTTNNPAYALFDSVSGIPLWRAITTADIVTTITINNFGPTVVNYEKGTTVTTPAFTATYNNGPPTLADLTRQIQPGSPPPPYDTTNVDSLTLPAAAFNSTETFTSTGSLTAGIATVGQNPTVNFTLYVEDGAGPAPTKNSLIRWTRFMYWGQDAVASPTLTDAYVKTTLPASTGGNKALNPTKTQRIQMLAGNAPANKYVFFAWPTYYGTLSQVVDNLTNFVVTSAFVLVGTASSVTVEVAPGTIGEAYYVYRSVNLQNGPVDITVS